MSRFLLLLPLASVLACRDTATRPRSPGAIQVVSGDDQQGDAGLELPQPLVVRVLDEDGHALPDQEIFFTVSAGNGQVNPSSASTDTNGIAQAKWTLGAVAGTSQTVVAAVSSGDIIHQFHATARTGAPAGLARLTPATGTVYSGAVIAPIKIQVVDAFQNPVHQAGINLSFRLDRLSAFASRVTGTNATATDANGVGTFSDLVITTVARQPLPPTVLIFEGAGLQPVFDTAQTQYGAPAAITGGDPMSGRVGFTFYPQFKITDAWGNGLEGVPIDISYPQPDGTPQSVQRTTEFLGTVQLQLNMTAAGTYAVTATSPALPNQVASVTLKVDPNPPGAPEHLLVVSGDGASAPAGRTLPPLVVRVIDKNGTPVPNVDVEWNVASGVGYLSAVSTTTDSSGQTSVSLTLTSTPGPVVVRATVGGIATLITVTFALTGT